MYKFLPILIRASFFNKKGQGEIHLALVYGSLFIAFVTDAVYGGPKGREEIRRFHTHLQLLLLPLFASFSRNHNTASGQENYASYNKYNSKWHKELLSLFSVGESSV